MLYILILLDIFISSIKILIFQPNLTQIFDNLMEPNGRCQYTIEEDLDESGFIGILSISGIEMENKMLKEKVQKLEVNYKKYFQMHSIKKDELLAKKNIAGKKVVNKQQKQSSECSILLQIGLQIGDKFAKMENEMEAMKKEIAAFVQLEKEWKNGIGKLEEENGKLKIEMAQIREEFAKNNCALEENKKVKIKILFFCIFFSNNFFFK